MTAKTMHDLLLEELRDIYHAEKQITKALPKMAKSASTDELKQAFEQHLEETKTQIERLEQVFSELETRPRGKTCEGMQGIVEEAKELMDEIEDADLLDAGLIAAAQKVEHYEIAAYGSARTWARLLGMAKVADLLEKTLEEEKATDAKLNTIATEVVNEKARAHEPAA